MLHGIVVIDAYLVSSLGEAAVAVLGLSASIAGLLIGLIVAFSNATQIRIAQAFGSDDEVFLKSALLAGLTINVAVVLVGLAVLGLSAGAIIDGLAHDAWIATQARRYLTVFAVVILAEEAALTATPARVVIAWNESPEAMTAVRHAMPLLKAATEVDICIIAPERHSPDVADPGAELSRMLARHGVKVSVSILAQTLPRVSEMIARHVADTDADLLVMGAYGHSRFREAILGGATRNMLEHAEVPVVMAH